MLRAHQTEFRSIIGLRLHFEWLAEEKLLIVNHCGKHLNF